MEPMRIGPLRVRAVGGGDGPAILLCHGFGAPGDDLVSLAGAVDAGRGVRWFFPEAPIELDLGWGMSGRAWWKIEMARMARLLAAGQGAQILDETPEGLPDARGRLEATIAALEQDHGVRRDRLIIGGFSQGAMLTTEVALHAEVPFAGLAILSGMLISSARWIEAARARGSSIHAVQTHGQRDPVLPFAGAEALRAVLVQSGATVDWVAHGGQHEIPAVALERLGAFARSRFG